LNEIQRIEQIQRENNKMDWELLYYKGIVLYNLNKLDEAVLALEEGHLLNKNNKQINLCLLWYYKEYADYLIKHERLDDAVIYYKKYVRLTEKIVNK
jgi:tetratricopeptide (TPR) repeat protein